MCQQLAIKENIYHKIHIYMTLCLFLTENLIVLSPTTFTLTLHVFLLAHLLLAYSTGFLKRHYLKSVTLVIVRVPLKMLSILSYVILFTNTLKKNSLGLLRRDSDFSEKLACFYFLSSVNS